MTPESNLSAESKSLYITKDAADDLVQILGKYLLALECCWGSSVVITLFGLAFYESSARIR